MCKKKKTPRQGIREVYDNKTEFRFYDYDDIMTAFEHIKQDLTKIVKEHTRDKEMIKSDKDYIREKEKLLQSELDSALLIINALDLTTN